MNNKIGNFLFNEELTPERIGAARIEDIPEQFTGMPLMAQEQASDGTLSAYAKGDHIHSAETIVRNNRFSLLPEHFPLRLQSVKDDIISDITINEDGTYTITDDNSKYSGKEDIQKLIEIKQDSDEYARLFAYIYISETEFIEFKSKQGFDINTGIYSGTTFDNYDMIKSLGDINLDSAEEIPEITLPVANDPITVFVRNNKMALASKKPLTGKTYIIDDDTTVQDFLTTLVNDLGGDIQFLSDILSDNDMSDPIT